MHVEDRLIFERIELNRKENQSLVHIQTRQNDF